MHLHIPQLLKIDYFFSFVLFSSLAVIGCYMVEQNFLVFFYLHFILRKASQLIAGEISPEDRCFLSSKDITQCISNCLWHLDQQSGILYDGSGFCPLCLSYPGHLLLSTSKGAFQRVDLATSSTSRPSQDLKLMTSIHADLKKEPQKNLSGCAWAYREFAKRIILI